MIGNFEPRLLDRIVKENECWLWTGPLNRDGYVEFRQDKRFWMGHRYFYTKVFGEIPEGLEVDHLCRVRHCVNPAHLEAVSHEENIKRGARAQATKCKRGHDRNAENTRIDPSTQSRVCRVCVRENSKKYKERKGSR